MHPVFQKLNYKDQAAVYVLNAPQSFLPVVDEMRSLTAVHLSLSGAESVPFVIAFATMKSEVDAVVGRIAELAKGDALVWFAYPKGTSKKYTCDFNRDTGWERLIALGFETVRAVAIDEDWSALRFRRVEFIKNMTRRKKA